MPKFGRLYLDNPQLLTGLDGQHTLSFDVHSDSAYNARAVVAAMQSAKKTVAAEFKTRTTSRTLKQNAMMWALLEIMAEAENGRPTGDGAWHCYLDMLEYCGAKYEWIMVLPEALEAMQEQFRAMKVFEYRDYNGKRMAVCKCFIGSSHFDTTEMRLLIDTILDRLGQMNLTEEQARQVFDYRLEWIQLAHTDKGSGNQRRNAEAGKRA